MSVEETDSRVRQLLNRQASGELDQLLDARLSRFLDGGDRGDRGRLLPGFLRCVGAATVASYRFRLIAVLVGFWVFAGRAKRQADLSLNSLPHLHRLHPS